MIGFLRGRIIETHTEGLILDVGGVGYDLSCSANTLDEVLDRTEAHLWVHTHLREDALVLFGFATAQEKQVFLSLLKVNGIGPKMAIKILSGTSLERLFEMIEAGDVKALSALPKVGKKTAEQLILTLKGQLVLSGEADGSVRARGGPRQVRDEVVSALVNLGFRLPDVEKVVADMPDEFDLQQGVRRGLQALSGGL